MTVSRSKMRAALAKQGTKLAERAAALCLYAQVSSGTQESQAGSTLAKGTWQRELREAIQRK